jgi:hypothetical protein
MRKEVELQKFACEVSFKEATFDIAEDHVAIRNVVLLGAESKNKRKYLRDAMEKAVDLYGNVRAFANHQSEGTPFAPGGPDVMMLAGKFTNPRFDSHEMKIRADFEGLHAEDPITQKFVHIAQNMSDIAGFSHNAKGKIRVEDGVEIVEEIKEVYSVDLVAYPATTSGIFESEENKMKAVITTEEAARELLSSDPDSDYAIIHHRPGLLNNEEKQKAADIAAQLKIDSFVISE